MIIRAVPIVLLGLATAAPVRSDQKADAIIAKARQVAAKATSLSADAVIRSGPEAAMTAEIKLKKPNLGLLRMKIPGQGEAVMASDGTNAYTVGIGEKQYMKMPAEREGLPGVGSGEDDDPVAAFYAPAKLANGGKATALGPQTLNGRTFEVVRLVKSATLTEKLYFGPEGLLEGVTVARMAGGKAQSTQTIWLKNVKLDAAMGPEQFAYKPPADYKEFNPGDADAQFEAKLVKVGADAPKFTLPGPRGGQVALENTVKGKKAVLVNFWFYN